ncbi:BIRC3 [Branchiostoma lanceolatum]|uniref:BIRC3 protein n=1 Tax=Branchiostoma lanceolatum TaxID=7740 RepID=A0A8J9ZCK7_BRALA|nr:BIRC3 [Branchiostoma lanceolatum]
MSKMMRDDAEMARNLFLQGTGHVSRDRTYGKPATIGQQGRVNVTSGSGPTGASSVLPPSERHSKASSFRKTGEETGNPDRVRWFPSGREGSTVTSRPRDLTKAADRLSTFFDWPPSAQVRAELLAKQGFYYLGTGDKVECAFCGGQLHQWELCDDPETEHSRHFPQCPRVVSIRTYFR